MEHILLKLLESKVTRLIDEVPRAFVISDIQSSPPEMKGIPVVSEAVWFMEVIAS